MGIAKFKTVKNHLDSGETGNDNTPFIDDLPEEGFSKNDLFFFIAKSLVFIGLLYAFSLTAPGLPSWAIALAWVILTAFVSLGVAYASVMRKTHRQVKYQDGGRLDLLNKGRKGCLFVAFIIGSALALSLITEVPKWNVFEWVLAVVSIPLFFFVSVVVRRIISRNYKAPFRTWGIICWSSVITALILCIIYVVGLICASTLMPGPGSGSALQAFLHAQVPYKESPSTLMASVGQISALFDGLTQYAIEESAVQNLWVAVVWRLIIGASTFFAITNLLSICWMKPIEIKRIFQPLEDLTKHENQAKKKLTRSHVFFTVCYAVLFWGLFLGLDYNASTFSDSWVVSQTRNVIQDQLSKSVCIIEGKYYDRQIVTNTITEESEHACEIQKQAREELVPLIDASFDKRMGNVDSFLAWYCSPDGYKERAAALVNSSAHKTIQTKFDETIENEINDYDLYQKVFDYSEKAEAVTPQLMEALQSKELHTDMEWMLERAEQIDKNELNSPAKEVRNLLEINANGRNGLISVSCPECYLIPFPDTCKNMINESINSERDRYIAMVGGR